MVKMMLKMKMMESFMGGKSSTGMSNMFGSSEGGNDFFKTMMLMNMFGGGNGIGDMFDNMFDFDSDEPNASTIVSDIMNIGKDEKAEDDIKEEK